VRLPWFAAASLKAGPVEYSFLTAVCLILSCLQIIKKFAILNIFVFFMCISVLADNILQFYVGLEAMSVISAVLVGLEEGGDTRAPYVFLFNKFASLLFLIGMCMIFREVGSVELREIARFCGDRGDELLVPTIILVVACLCKGAQFPFSRWLIEATKADLFVSILFHSATIVSIGVIFLIKCDFLVERFQYIRSSLIYIGIFSALLMACRAFLLDVRDVKKVMAYLTASSTGLMFAACGAGYVDVAAVYSVCHASFKSALFLSLMHARHGPIVWASVLAASGFPLLSGSFARSSLANALSSGEHSVILVMEIAIGLLTNVVACRGALACVTMERHAGLRGSLPVLGIVCGGGIVSYVSWSSLVSTSGYLKVDIIEILSLATAVGLALVLRGRLSWVRSGVFEILRPRSLLDRLSPVVEDMSFSLSRFGRILDHGLEYRTKKCVDWISRRIAVWQRDTVPSHIAWIVTGFALILATLILGDCASLAKYASIRSSP
jgi:hypothetical protein